MTEQGPAGRSEQSQQVRPTEQADAPARTTYGRVRRSPRYLPFMGTGAVLGFLVALVVTLVAMRTPEAPSPTGGIARSYSAGQVLLYLGVLAVLAGVALGAAVAFFFERRR